MKILFVQKVKALAGSEKYFLELVPALKNKGIEVEFVCIYNQIDLEKAQHFIKVYQDLNLKIHTFKVRSDRSILSILKFIRSIYKNGQFDMVHSHLIHADFWVTLLKRTGTISCPIVSTKHGYDEAFISDFGFDGHQVPKNFYYKLCRFSERKIDRSFAVSNGLKQLFIDSGISKIEKIKTIHHGFDLPEMQNDKNTTYRLADQQIIIIGRIIPFKGHHYALHALANIKPELNDFCLVILGHGDEALIKDLKHLVIKLKLENHVQFMGYKTNIYDYLANSDVMLVPSIAEGFGLVFLEAMQAELPIIGFDVPATNEIIQDQKTGLLVPPYDENKLGNAILELLQNESKRKKLSQQAKERLVSYFCLDRMVDETVAFYKQSLHVRKTK